MQDILNVLQASGTITDSANSTGLDIGLGGTLRRQLFARCLYSAAYAGTGGQVITFKIQHSSDNGTWYDHASGALNALTLPTGVGNALSGEFFIPVATDLRYIRLVVTFSASTNTPTVTREAHLVQVAW